MQDVVGHVPAADVPPDLCLAPVRKRAELVKPMGVVPLIDRERRARHRLGTTQAGDPGLFAGEQAREGFDLAVLFPNSFESALQVFLAGARRRVGYARDGRSLLLTTAVPVAHVGHERYYYLELLRRAGLIESVPVVSEIRFDGVEEARERGQQLFRSRGIDRPVIGVSPGAAYGTAKRWLPERFAEAAGQVAKELGAGVAIFGSKDERELCEEVAGAIDVAVKNFAGETTLAEFIELAAACSAYLSNDSGAMHIASALGIPTVAVFGATDDATTGPTGRLSRVVREAVECSPCLKRECPIDHRCMTRVAASRVAEAALELLK